jgi:adenylylsulfate kinase
MIIQLCGLSGSGKSSISNAVKQLLCAQKVPVEIIDGDEYRKALCADLGFSKEDRQTNIRRLAFVASRLSKHGIICIISAINPYEDIRKEVRLAYANVKTVFINCELPVLIERDTKGLYKRAYLPDGHPDKVHNLSGINDPFERPEHADLVINTHAETLEQSASTLSGFILQSMAKAAQVS